ncbi:MAG: hypothetical protein Q9195_006599 [Heterodermia aff. obscurata]
MPHSPYQTTVYAPIQDLEPFRQNFAREHIRQDNGERDKDAEEMLLQDGESLLEHCDFLETKLDIKKRDLGQSIKENQALKQRVEALEKQSRAQKEEIAALKLDLETARAGTEVKEQSDSESAGDKADNDPQNGESKADETEKLGTSENSLVAPELANPRKRSLEDDATKDMKKSKT